MRNRKTKNSVQFVSEKHKSDKKKPQNTINFSSDKNTIVRLRGKILSNKNISLYLDYYKGYSKEKELNIGIKKIKTHREIEYLKKYLIGNPLTPEERQKNDEVLNLAQYIRNNRESEIMHNEAGLLTPFKKKANFFDFCSTYIETYQKKDIRMIKLAVKTFNEYTNATYLKPIEIDQNKITGYRDYLINKYNGASPNSIFARFKKIIKNATDHGYFIKNPAKEITIKSSIGISKEILFPDELINLYNTDCSNKEIKRAFLFCINTGLRFIDVKDLQYKHISNSQIRKNQSKTGNMVTIDLNKTALHLLGERKEPEEYIFKLPSLTGCLKVLKTWTKKAGINKNITWHSARHSFATMLLINKTDIKTVGNLLGHSKLEHTQKYTHIVDSLKKKAVDSLLKWNKK